jgi:hypothetical protein
MISSRLTGADLSVPVQHNPVYFGILLLPTPLDNDCLKHFAA